MPEEPDGIRMADPIEKPAVCEFHGIFEIPSVGTVHVDSFPQLRVMVEGKITHEVHASEKKIQSLILRQFTDQIFVFFEVADLETELDLHRIVLLPHLIHQFQILGKALLSRLSLKPVIDKITCRTGGIVHGRELRKHIVMLQKPDL